MKLPLLILLAVLVSGASCGCSALSDAAHAVQSSCGPIVQQALNATLSSSQLFDLCSSNQQCSLSGLTGLLTEIIDGGCVVSENTATLALAKLKSLAAAACTMLQNNYCVNDIAKAIKKIELYNEDSLKDIDNSDLEIICTPCATTFAKAVVATTTDDAITTIANNILNACLKEDDRFCYPLFAPFVTLLRTEDSIVDIMTSDLQKFWQFSDVLCGTTCVQRAAMYTSNVNISKYIGLACTRTESGNLCLKEMFDNPLMKCVITQKNIAQSTLVGCVIQYGLPSSDLLCCLKTFLSSTSGVFDFDAVFGSQLCAATQQISITLTLSNVNSSFANSWSQFKNYIATDLSLLFGATPSLTLNSGNSLEITAVASASTNIEAIHKNYDIAVALFEKIVPFLKTKQALLSANLLEDPSLGAVLTLSSGVPSKPSSYPSAAVTAGASLSSALSFTLAMLFAILAIFAF